MDKLAEIFRLQDALNTKVGVSLQDINKMSQTERLSWIRDYCHALNIELGEFLIEVGAKWWKEFDYSAPKAKEEAIDMFHFLISIMMMLGITPDDLYDEYVRKNAKNMVRPDWINNQVEGISP